MMKIGAKQGERGMARSKKDNITEQVAALRADGIEFVRFELPDLHAISRSKLIPIDAVEGYARKGLNFYGGILALDTASNVISGAGLNDEISYADSKLFADFSTLRRVPWKQNTAKVICDVAFQDNSPYKSAPRYVLRSLIKEAAELGFDVMMGHEYEFYLLDRQTLEPLFGGVHIFNTTRNTYVDAVEVILRNLQGIGLDLITHNCEYAPSQFEINYGPAIGVEAADKAFTFRNTVKEVAHLQGYLATFMSKPINGMAGCGCHFHISLLDRKTGKNIFFDPADKDGLSLSARQFAAGILANPYLTAAGTLAAGLLGLKGKLKLGPQSKGPSEDDPQHPKLPTSLEQSLAALEADQAFGQMLGPDLLKLFLTIKRHELARFRSHITDWERNEYLEVF
jgi:glutamine synthetase